jgi:hypothetical protein
MCSTGFLNSETFVSVGRPIPRLRYVHSLQTEYALGAIDTASLQGDLNFCVASGWRMIDPQ